MPGRAMTALEVRDSSGRHLGTWRMGEPPPLASGSDLRFSLPGRPEPVTDVFGITATGLRRAVPVRTELTLLVDLLTTEGPFGAAEARMVMRASGSITSSLWLDRSGSERRPVEADHDPLAVEATYAELLDWLHGDTNFGHLLLRGRRARGDWPAFSAMAGIVQARAPGPEAEVAAVMLELVGASDDTAPQIR